MIEPTLVPPMIPFERFLFLSAKTSSLTVGLAWLAGLVVLVTAAGCGYNQWMRWRRLGSRMYLFGELCRAHGLEMRDAGLLRRIAVKFGLSQPGVLFVDPRFFDRLTASPDPGFRPGDVARLRKRLFGREKDSSDETSGSNRDEPR